MCNNLTFLSNPVKRVQLLIHLTLWTFSVDSFQGGLGWIFLIFEVFAEVEFADFFHVVLDHDADEILEGGLLRVPA